MEKSENVLVEGPLNNIIIKGRRRGSSIGFSQQLNLRTEQRRQSAHRLKVLVILVLYTIFFLVQRANSETKHIEEIFFYILGPVPLSGRRT